MARFKKQKFAYRLVHEQRKSWIAVIAVVLVVVLASYATDWDRNEDGTFDRGPSRVDLFVSKDHPKEEIEKAVTRFRQVACETQSTPVDPQDILRELDTEAVFRASWEQKCDQHECTFPCGNSDPNFKTQVPPPGTLVNSMQVAMISCILHLESTRLGRPANLLVWGLGNDSPLWANSTTGNVIFVENNKDWAQMWRDRNFEVRMVNYGRSRISQTLPKLENSLYRPKLLKGFDQDTAPFDVILVDAPLGCRKRDVGRFSAVYISKDIVDRQGHGVIVVDDYNRDPEKILSDKVLECSECGGKYEGEFWRLHPASRSFVEKTAVFSFGKSITAVLSEALEAIK